MAKPACFAPRGASTWAMIKYIAYAPVSFCLLYSALFTVSCANSSGAAHQIAVVEPVHAPYGDYLMARYATAQADVKSAAKHYIKALARDPENKDLREQAMVSLLFSRQIHEARLLAAQILQDEPNETLAILISIADAMQRQEYAKVNQILDTVQLGPLNQVAGGLIGAWAYQGQHQNEAALSALANIKDAPLLGDLIVFHKALILADDGQIDAAETAFAAALQTKMLPYRTSYAWAAWWMGRGEKELAQELVTNRLRINPNEMEAKYLAEKIQTNARAPRPFSTPRQGAAEALYNHAQILVERSIHDWAVIYLELALHVDPDHGVAQDLLGRLYQAQGRGDDALALFANVSKDSPWYVQAKLNSANGLIRNEQTADGIALLQDLVAHSSSERAKRALATALQIDKQYEAALTIFSELMAQEENNEDAKLYFAKAVCLERTKRWKQAIPNFRKSLEIEPKQADVLNYLGYTFVDAGENLEEGFSLIRQAIELSPKAGYIRDSLGWAHYRLGQYKEAVAELEIAVALEAADATINDHLGDAYWQIGRKLEAGFQWQRVLSLDPDPAVDIAKIKAKINEGLSNMPKQNVAHKE